MFSSGKLKVLHAPSLKSNNNVPNLSNLQPFTLLILIIKILDKYLTCISAGLKTNLSTILSTTTENIEFAVRSSTTSKKYSGILRYCKIQILVDIA